jgi:hypothetical protein
MVIKNAVVVGNDKNRLVVVFLYEKQFAELIVMHYGVGFGFVMIQSVISLNPIFVFVRINDFINEVSRQGIFFVFGLIYTDFAAIVDIPSVASTDHHQPFIILA